MLIEFCSQIQNAPFLRFFGRVGKVHRDSVVAYLPGVRVGALCRVETEGRSLPIEIVSLSHDGHVGMPLNDLRGVQLGDRVMLMEDSASIRVGDGLIGQVVDSLMVPYESSIPLVLPEELPLYGSKLNPLERSLIDKPLDLGIRAINACLTCGQGQRQGIFAGSGVGKSVLLGMMARFTRADVVVIALIGERGREVKEFIEQELGEEGRKRAVVVVETAERSAVRRVRGAFAAATVAEYFMKKGAHVLLLMDSLTRFAMAQREIGLTAGETPTTKGYPPSAFSRLPALLERAGNWSAKGSLTGLYTVLVEGDDMDDPVADSCRAILDGHVVLSRKLAHRGHYPAVDVLSSVSRVMDRVVSKDQIRLSSALRQILARYQENEDAILYGMYQKGSDPLIDECIERQPQIRRFLQQGREERSSLQEAEVGLDNLFASDKGDA